MHGPGFPDPLVMVDLTDKGDQPQGEEEYLYYLKDMLGSVTALANSNGTVVERYVYDPYGKTTVQAVTFYHDADLDGDIDVADEAHLNACAADSPADPLCVFIHDRNNDNVVDLYDQGVFAGFEGYNSNGTSPPPNWERTSSAYFDPDSDGDVDLYDFSGFQECMGSGDEPCLFLYDANNNDEVDLDDFIEFQQTLNDSTPPTKHTVPTGQSRYGNPFMWTGQRYDAPVGLYHFKYRSYSPELGRWLQRDPLGYVDGAGLYEYVASDPVSWIDPLGLNGEYVAKFGLIDWILTGEWDPSPEVCSEAWDAFDRSNWDRSHGTADAVVDNVTVGIVGSVGGATFDPENRAGAKKTAGTIIVVAEAATGAAVVGKVVAKTGVKGGKKVVKEVVEEAEEIAEETAKKKAAKGNKWGSKGKPDHQNKVGDLYDKAKGEADPGEKVLREKKIRGHDSNRNPDVQIVGEDGKTRKIYEAERHPGRKRNRDREAEYDGLGIDHETHPLD